VRFYYSFTSKENLYIVMEYLNGGDCFSLLRMLGALEEDPARMYTAEIVLALEYCHTQVRGREGRRAQARPPPHPLHLKDAGLSEQLGESSSGFGALRRTVREQHSKGDVETARGCSHLSLSRFAVRGSLRASLARGLAAEGLRSAECRKGARSSTRARYTL
jgi:hypothetical protein